MTKQIIEIEVPEGKKAIWKDGRIVYEDIAPELPETWEEFCKFHPIEEEEYYINISSKIIGFSNNKRNINDDKNMLSSKEAANAHIALMQLHQLRDCYRQGWVPDWENAKIKYCICLYDNKLKAIQVVERSHFLTFQSMELAEKFLKNFKDLIKQAGDLI